MDNNLTVVTEPDYWFGRPESVFLLGCDNWTVEQFIKELPGLGDYSLHVGEQDSSLDWIVNTASRSTVVIVSNEYQNKIIPHTKKFYCVAFSLYYSIYLNTI